jgi:regulator of sirC expression with transglutaminase-like and TPR domain
MKPDSELKSLLMLMDDPDKVVRNAVRDRLIERGEETVDLIERELIPDSSDEKREHYLSFLDDVKADIAMNKLSALIENPQPILDLGLFYVTKIADTTTDELLYFTTLESLSEEIGLEIGDDKTSVESVKIFNYIFFNRFKFHHTDTQMQYSESALIDRVLLSRGGNPVSISLAYFLLSRSVGLPVYPLCFPGGFVPVYLDNEGKIVFYLNIFKQGSIFLEETLKQFFEDIGMVYNPESLKIEQERALVAIYSELLGFIYKNEDNALVVSRMEKLSQLLGGRKYL